MMLQASSRYTYEDWLTTPDDFSHRYEVIDGELFVTGIPTIRHQQVVGNLCYLAATLAREHRLGKVVSYVGVVLQDDAVMVPDVVFVRNERLHIIDWDRDVMGPPDLIAEVLTPSRRDFDRDLKRKRYMATGVPELWTVDADEHVLEHYEQQSDEQAADEDDAAFEGPAEIAITVPAELVPAVRELIAKHRRTR